MKKENKVTQVIGAIIFATILIAFTWLGFFSKQACGPIDDEYLYCKLHPASFIQVIGVLGFYFTLVILSSSITKLFTFWNEANSSKWNFIFAAVGIASFLMLWFG